PPTGVRQHARTEKDGGVVRVFIGDSRLSADEKYRVEAECAKRMAAVSDPVAWAHTSGYQLLALEHKLAARRGGFLDVYLAMDLLDGDAASPQGNGENSGPSVARVLLGPMLELACCVELDGTFNESKVTEVLRRHDVLKDLPVDLEERRDTLEAIHAAVQRFVVACVNPVSTVRDVLEPIINAGLFDQGSQLRLAFLDTNPPPEPPAVKSAELKVDRQRRGWCSLFESPWSQIALYRTYLSGKAKLATHQVVKGSEFQHVMVVMDDQDAGGSLFSYDKLLGGASLTKADHDNVAQGKETSIDRTLRLLYVTCSRAEESLALMLWSANPAGALAFLSNCGWFTNEEIVQMY
ncbi:MAG TPA: Fis family transcriptional regulator, partial [Pusillimonas sp.]|nr:Fis family transcriptional regulator [Pusillimonas sp.]